MAEAAATASSARDPAFPELARHDLDQLGYCLVTDALPGPQIEVLRQSLDQLTRTEVEADIDFVYCGGCNQRIWSLLNKGQEFVDLAENETALTLAAAVLDQPLLLSNISANIAGPGGTPMVPHTDQLYAPPPWPYALACTVIWAVDEFRADNGATLVAPGSHRDPEAPPASGYRAVECPAGTAVCFDARLWHGTGANRSASLRRAVLAYYCRPFVRQQENFFVSLDPKVLATGDDRLRRLLGWEPYEYVGMINGADRDAPRY